MEVKMMDPGNKRENLQLAASIFSEVFSKAPWDFTWMSPEKSLEYFTFMEAHPKSLGFFLYQEAALIGVCMGQINPYFGQSIYEIKEICVLKAYQGKGAGTFFLQQVEMFVGSIGVEIINLSTGRLVPAFDFYVKNEYTVAENTVFMHKMIKSPKKI